ncbi:putative phospholipase B-like 2 [Platysternon megacephalum]|uniref:Putative phospholipase B-like 2 n=1 Tax=Platysternon megacephalum TaxID=55544 RepID=A0A4D9E7G6_9SAUR|nr:putative phospholipase B-like 2 [Platysternon megacephalum]
MNKVTPLVLPPTYSTFMGMKCSGHPGDAVPPTQIQGLNSALCTTVLVLFNQCKCRSYGTSPGASVFCWCPSSNAAEPLPGADPLSGRITPSLRMAPFNSKYFNKH